MEKYLAQATSILHTTNFKKLNPSVLAYIKYPKALDLVRLEQAVDLLSQTIPQISCKYNAADNTFSPVVSHAKEILHALGENETPFHTRFNFQTMPQLAIYYRTVADGFELFFMESHIFADGVGLKEVIYSLIRLYNHPQENLLGANHLDNGEVLEQFRHEDLSAVVRDDREVFELHLPFPKAEPDEPTFFDVHQLRLDETEFLHLHRAAKSQGLSLNDVLLASYMRLLKKYNPDAPYIALACPTDTRQFLAEDLKNELHIGNYTARYNPRVEIGTQESLLDSAKKVHAEMTLLKDKHQFLQSVLGLYLQSKEASVEELRDQARQNYHARSIAYTNMAIFEASKLVTQGMAAIDGYTSGSFRQAPLFQICFGSFKGRLNLVCNVIGTKQQQAYADTLQAEVKQDLLSLK